MTAARSVRPEGSRQRLRQILTLGLPIMGGTACNVLVNLMLVAVLPAHGLGMAASTLVGQAMGRGDMDDARRWALDVSKVAAAFVCIVGVAMCVLPELLLWGFIRDVDTRALAALPLRITGLLLPLDGVGMVMMNALVGAGASRLTLWVSASLQWLLFLPMAYVIGPALGFGLLGIWTAFMAYRCLQAAVFSAFWLRGGWASIRL